MGGVAASCAEALTAARPNKRADTATVAGNEKALNLTICLLGGICVGCRGSLISQLHAATILRPDTLLWQLKPQDFSPAHRTASAPTSCGLNCDLSLNTGESSKRG